MHKKLGAAQRGARAASRAAEGASGRTFDAGFTAPDGTLILMDTKRTALIHTKARSR
jgi:hypothetical protein